LGSIEIIVITTSSFHAMVGMIIPFVALNPAKSCEIELRLDKETGSLLKYALNGVVQKSVCRLSE
jgi:hypothetical protein